MDSKQPRAPQVAEQFYALAARGVQHFPKPTPRASAPVPVDLESVATPEAVGSVAGAVVAETLLTCQACPLAAERKRVVTQTQWSPFPLFVLAEFPTFADEDGTGVWGGESSSTAVLHRLFEKLGVLNAVHASFAIKCAPRKHIPNTSLKACSNHLSHELAAVDPRAIICFGERAVRALHSITGGAFQRTLEVGEESPQVVAGKERRIFVMPSAAELDAHPDWRGEVWRALQCLKQIH